MKSNIFKELINKHCKNVRKYELFNNSIIFTDCENKKFVVKKNNGNNIIKMYDYLNSRGFNYLPKLSYYDSLGYIYEYEEDVKSPNEQRISDLVKMDALLHNKTVYYKDISLDEVKEIYEELDSKIKNTYNYYNDLMTSIESNIFMSPSMYLFARNCSVIFSCLNFCKQSLNKWYELTSNKNKKREVLLHNNLDINHLIRGNENVLISWDKAIFDVPIYDFINLYKKNYDKYDFTELYKEYQKNFPLLEDEKILMFINLFLPEKITISNNELICTMEVNKLFNYLYTTDKLFMENEAEYTKE